MFSFTLLARDSGSRARTGIFHTPRHDLETPELALTATEAEIRAVPRDLWPVLPTRYLIVNTYHTFTKQLVEPIARAGGVHSYMGLSDRVFATDSGGFQVFSLGFGKRHHIGKLAKAHTQNGFRENDENGLTITEQAASFIHDGRPITLSPEKSMDIQHRLGADIMFAFDECTSPYNSKKYTQASMERTHRWLDRCIKAHREYEDKQVLFGIVQGGEYQDLREASARMVGRADVSGFGIGGSFGDFKEALGTTLGWVTPFLPEEKPRHLLGIGKIRDIFAAVEQGIDLFDCVIPTREARHRMIYTKQGRFSVRKMKHLDELFVPTCACPACQEGVTFRTLWDWFLKKDLRAPMYATVHNIWFYATLMKEIREAIEQHTFEELRASYLKWY